MQKTACFVETLFVGIILKTINFDNYLQNSTSVLKISPNSFVFLEYKMAVPVRDPENPYVIDPFYFQRNSSAAYPDSPIFDRPIPHKIHIYSVTFVGGFFTLLLIYLVLFRTPKDFRPYSRYVWLYSSLKLNLLLQDAFTLRTHGFGFHCAWLLVPNSTKSRGWSDLVCIKWSVILVQLQSSVFIHHIVNGSLYSWVCNFAVSVLLSLLLNCQVSYLTIFKQWVY
jgi:hypothetical protein